MTMNRRALLRRAGAAAGSACSLPLIEGVAQAASDPLAAGRLHQHVVDLCAFGPRRTGLPPQRDASLWLAQKLRAAGLEVQVNDYSFRQWLLDDWSVDLLPGDGSSHRLATHPMWAMGTSVEGEAELVDVGYGTERELDRVDLRGKIAVVDGEMIANVFATYAGLLGQVYWKVVERGGVGMLGTADAPGNLVRLINVGDNRLDDNPMPAWTVGREDFARLRAAAKRGARARYSLAAEFTDGTTQDVVGVLPGTGQDALLVDAHVDSMFTGALDDATGVAGVIGLAEHFAAKPKRARPKTMYFVGVTGHDTGYPHNGMRNFVESHPELLDRLAASITLDHLAGQGATDTGDGIRLSPLDEERCMLVSNNLLLATMVGSVIVKYGLMPTVPLPEPLARANKDMEGRLVDAGVPSVNVTMAYPWYHTPDDTPDKIPPAQLRRAVRAHADLLEQLQWIPRSTLRAAERTPKPKS